MRDKIEYFIVVFFIKISKILPQKVVFKILKLCSILLFYILPNRRKIAIFNLQNALNLNENEAKILAKKNFIEISKSVAEILLLLVGKMGLDEQIENGKEALNKLKNIVGENKNGIIFVTAHFGNWEYLAHYFGTHGYQTAIIGRKGNNELIENRITTPFRKKFGNDLIYKDDAMMKMVRTLKSGGNVGILTDQKGDRNSVETTFFGRVCTTTKSVASLHLKFNSVIVPIFAKRLENSKFEIIIEKFPEIPANLSKDEAEKFITQKCNDIFENVVRSAPEQWFWMHNRWRVKV